jgi:catechol 2,3-dioxygenase-like lactoylglutathione lyase family enzyme
MAPRLDLLGIVTADLPASLAFYRLLGLSFAPGAEAEGHVETVLPSGLRLAFDTVEVVRSFDEGWTPPSGGHRIALAFLCDSPADVTATHDALVAAGAASHKAPWDAFWGQRYAVVLDPDGNHIELFAPL